MAFFGAVIALAVLAARPPELKSAEEGDVDGNISCLRSVGMLGPTAGPLCACLGWCTLLAPHPAQTNTRTRTQKPPPPPLLLLRARPQPRHSGAAGRLSHQLLLGWCTPLAPLRKTAHDTHARTRAHAAAAARAGPQPRHVAPAPDVTAAFMEQYAVTPELTAEALWFRRGRLRPGMYVGPRADWG